MSHRIKAFVAPHTELGESPLYREEDNTLHYVDVLGRNINILQLGGEHKHERRTIQCPEPITFLSFHRDGGYLICSFSSIVRVTEDGKWTVLKRVFSDTTNMRFNDAGIDSTGRLWVGTIDRVLQKIPKTSPEADRYQPQGCIYRYDPDGTLSVVQEGGVGAGNGLCWSPGNDVMYFVDSYYNCIWAYNFDAAEGSISNQRAIVQRKKTEGEADGLLTDSQGNLYTFIWDGGVVIKYSYLGQTLKEWNINAARVTHGAWVGPSLDQLIVTTAKRENASSEWEGEEAGALFSVSEVGCTGLKKNKFGYVLS